MKIQFSKGAATVACHEASTSFNGAQFATLEAVNRPTVDTAAAAHYLNRRPQTLRAWACRENGPLRPIRICGRLAWKVADIKRLTGVI